MWAGKRSTAGLKEPPHLPPPPQCKVLDINVIFELISSRFRRLSPSSCIPVQPNTDILTVGLIFCAGWRGLDSQDPGSRPFNCNIESKTKRTDGWVCFTIAETVVGVNIPDEVWTVVLYWFTTELLEEAPFSFWAELGWALMVGGLEN